MLGKAPNNKKLPYWKNLNSHKKLLEVLIKDNNFVKKNGILLSHKRAAKSNSKNLIVLSIYYIL